MLAAVLLVVLVPTACMLWFLSAAMRNSSLAARQRLTDAYRQQVIEAKASLQQHWQGQLAVLDGPGDTDAATSFRRFVTTLEVDGVAIRRDDGGTVYPSGSIAPIDDPLNDDPNWVAAEDLEFAQSNPAAAAEAYGRIAREAPAANLQALALLARARCLAKAGKGPEAVAILTGPIAEKQLSGARAPDGRLISVSAAMLALRLLLDDPNSYVLESTTMWRKGDDGTGPPDRAAIPQVNRLIGWLRDRANDYGPPLLPSGQRLLVMNELSGLPGGPELHPPPFPTRAAEQLVAEYLDFRQPQPVPGRWSRSTDPEVWHVSSANRQVVAICRQRRLVRVSERICTLGGRVTGIALRLRPPGAAEDNDALLTVPAPAPLVGWEIRAVLAGADPFADAARRQNVLYLWAAGLGIAGVLVIALIIAGYLGRQMRLARLKNDLIATVSHELKTPLSSMRVLVDTLLAGRVRDEGQAGEYFQLIAKENERLSRLIDNFLTFSRMERNKVAFEREPVRVAEVIAPAVAAVRDRFDAPGCRLDVDVADDVPMIVGDRGALVTVLLNLLDNAHKYTGQQKQVTVRARRQDGGVRIEVRDNGVGLSRRAVRRVFDRFYQVDQHLSRGAGGCGLGLSIVRFVVGAHGGDIEVASRPGEGSTFTVVLPGHRREGSDGMPNDE